MRNKIALLILVSMVFLPFSASLANDDYNFTPVLQGIPEAPTYSMQYPMPEQNNYNQYGQVPVNNNYQQQTNGYYMQNNNYNNYGNYGANNEQLRGNVVMVPANTEFNAVLMTPLSSESAKAGDSVMMFLSSDFYYGKNLIAGAGSRIQGMVVKAKKGGYGNRSGQLQIKLTNIVTPMGQIIPISAHIKTEDGSGILKAGTTMDTTKEYAKKAAIGAASGAVLGVVLGALSGGKVGKGAIYGTAVGGGLGLVQPVMERGDNIDLPQNAQFDIILDQPITVSSNTQY